MAKKVVLTGFIASLLFVSLIAYSLPALAQNEHATVPDLPENASFHAIPFKETIIDANGYRAVFKPLITTTNDPSNYVSGTLFEGVPVLLLPRDDIDPRFVAVCSGTLLPTGMHILTAAHCVTDDSGELTLTPNAGAQARFGEDIDDISKRFYIDVSKTQVHDEYTGDLFRGNDIAVLTLYSEAIGIPTYDIYRGGAEIGENIQKVGFGRSGTLADGDVLGLGIKRDGLNKIDDDADAFLEFFNMVAVTHFDSGAILMYDGDNGLEKNDAFGVLLGDPNSPNNYNDLGIVNDEVLTAGGDSGGPAFYNNKIVGVTSFGVVVGGSFGSSTSDCHKSIVRGSNYPDSSCGEFAGDTRVSPHQTFILDAMGSTTSGPQPTVAVNDAYTTPFETILSVGTSNGVLSNDSGESLIASVSMNPGHGTLTLNSDGSFDYAPNSEFSGGDSFMYNVNGDDGVQDEGLVTITVEPSTQNNDTLTTINPIVYTSEGGRNGDKHVIVTLTLVKDDGSGPVSGATVSITLSNENTSWPGSATTGSTGTVSFSLKNAPNGTYTTQVDSVISTPAWDGSQPTDPGHTKP